MDISLQSRLLQVLQDGAFPRLGGERDVVVNSRVTTTTKDHLESLIKERKFREDLFFRISVMTITVPPLLERREQIIPFSEYFMNFCRKTGATLSAKATRLLRISYKTLLYKIQKYRLDESRDRGRTGKGPRSF